MGQIATAIPGVAAAGIGFPDYSRGISTQVEPLIRSSDDQYAFNEWDEQPVANGATGTFDLLVPTGGVVLAYDFYSSITCEGLQEMRVRAVDATGLVTATFIRKIGYGLVQEHLSRGYPIFGRVRFMITNRTGANQTFSFGASGVRTSKESYYLQVFPVP